MKPTLVSLELFSTKTCCNRFDDSCWWSGLGSAALRRLRAGRPRVLACQEPRSMRSALRKLSVLCLSQNTNKQSTNWAVVEMFLVLVCCSVNIPLVAKRASLQTIVLMMMMTMSKMRFAIVITLVACDQVRWSDCPTQIVQALHGANMRLWIASCERGFKKGTSSQWV